MIVNSGMPSSALLPQGELSNSDLLVGLSQGDGDCLETLVGRFEKRLVNLVYRIVGDWGIALDLTQEAFLRIYRRASTFRPDGNASAWMYSIAVNIARDYARTKKNRLFKIHTSTLAGDSENTFEFDNDSYVGAGRSSRGESYDPLVEQECNEKVHRTLQAMSEGPRSVLLLRDFEQLSYEQMSEVLGCEIGTVKSRLHRARKIFEQLFEVK